MNIIALTKNVFLINGGAIDETNVAMDPMKRIAKTFVWLPIKSDVVQPVIRVTALLGVILYPLNDVMEFLIAKMEPMKEDVVVVLRICMSVKRETRVIAMLRDVMELLIVTTSVMNLIVALVDRTKPNVAPLD